MSTSLSDAYRKIAQYVSRMDSRNESIKSTERRIASLQEDLNYCNAELETLHRSNNEDIYEAQEIANSVGIPFEYSPPSVEEWDSSSDWNSSSQYC